MQYRPPMTLFQDSSLQTFEEVRQSPAIRGWLLKLRSHDPSLAEHSLLVGAMASVFARSVGLNAHDEKLLVTGALLHDVGKLEVPSELLQKASALETDERVTMQSHPTKGLFLLLDQEWDPQVLEMVHSHHERLDGSGYPHGLQSTQVGRLVRMVMLCDIFAALIEKRSYQKASAEPLDIMYGMDRKLDRALLTEFARFVPAMAYRAQSLLSMDDTGGSLVDASLPVESENIR